MYIKDNIVYSNTLEKEIKLINFKIITKFYLLLTFSTEEKRVLDFSPFLEYPVYSPLKDETFFEKAYIDNGILTWNNEQIDISPETLYVNSYVYDEALIS